MQGHMQANRLLRIQISEPWMWIVGSMKVENGERDPLYSMQRVQ